MDDFGPILLILAVIAVALILGVVAFVRVQALSREIAWLRQLVLEKRDASVSAAPPPVAAPPAAAAPVPPPQQAPVAQPARIPEPAPVMAWQLAAPPATPAAVGQQQRPAPQPAIDIEAVIGGKWLNIIGLAAVLLASAFFLKYAFDNNWIGPIGRVALGLLAGTGLVAGSTLILRRGWVYFSEGITALGAGILYLSLYASWNYYHLVSTEIAFAGMAAVTASLIGLSLGRDSQRLGILALVGGYVTPLLVSTGTDAHVQLFSYLALLNAGLLWMALARDWRTLPGSFLFTIIYGMLWYAQFYDPSKLTASLIFASIFFVEFAVLPAIQARRSGQLRADAVALTLLNAAWYLAALSTMLYASHRWLLTGMVLAVAAFFLAIANLTASRPEKGQVAARPIFGSIALACVTVSIPIRIEGHWVAMAWAVEGAILVANGLRSGVRWLRGEGLVVLLLTAIALAWVPIPAPHAFFNGRFLTFAVFVGALAATAMLSRRYDSILNHDERTAYRIAEVAANVYAVWALSVEMIQALSAPGMGYLVPEQRFGLSLLWTLYATALVALGLERNSALVRVQGLVLFGIVLVTAPLLDLSVVLPAGQAFLNLRFLTCAVVFLSLGLSLLISKRHEEQLSDAERVAFKFFSVALNVFAVWALSVEVWQAFAPKTSVYGVEWTSAQQLGMSLVWTLYAATLIVIGIRRDSALVRWQALALFALVILKAAMVDLSSLALGYRIASFMALGVILLGASFLYQRRLFPTQKGTKT